MKFYFLISVFSVLLSFHALAQSVGQVIEVNHKEGLVTFFKGDLQVSQGEELLVKGSGGGVHLVRVTFVEGEKATAEIIGARMVYGGMIRRIEIGDQVRLEISRKDEFFFDFYLGSTNARPEFGYPGSGFALGMGTGGFFTEILTWDLRLQADSWGKDSFGVEKRRSSYMLGLGYNPGSFRLKGHIGVIDTMTILSEEKNPAYTDPYTGKAYSKEGVNHDDQFGFLLMAGYQYDLSEMNRTKRHKWYLLPQATYSDVFGSSVYEAHWTVGLSLGFSGADLL